MKKSLYLFACLLCGLYTAQAQRRSLQNKSTTVQPTTTVKKNTNNSNQAKTSPERNASKPIPTKVGFGYWSVGVTGHTNANFIGGLNFRKAWGKEADFLSFFQVDLLKTEDYREFSLVDPSSNISIRDGKINHLFTIRPSIGKEIVLLKKGPEGGSQLKGIVSTGPSLGILSPYYVNVTSQASNYSNIQPIKMLDYYTKQTGFTNYIVNESSMFKGLSEATFQPGWHLKTGLLIEFNTEKRNYMALEAGFMVDAFFKPVPMMLQNENRNVYSAAYLTFYLGKK